MDTLSDTASKNEPICQSFPNGCCGCCVNMKWPDRRIVDYLKDNTDSLSSLCGTGRRPGYRQLLKHYFRRRGWIDHALLFWLAIPSLGLSILLWKRFFGSCAFAGYVDSGKKKAGCLLHPRLIGASDMRKHAFPLLPTASCFRELECGIGQREVHELESAGLLAASRAGSAAVHGNGGSWLSRLRSDERGDVLMEYVIVTAFIVTALVVASDQVFDPTGRDRGGATPVGAMFNPAGFAEEEPSLGVFGDSFAGMIERITVGISRPAP